MCTSHIAGRAFSAPPVVPQVMSAVALLFELAGPWLCRYAAKCIELLTAPAAALRGVRGRALTQDAADMRAW